MGLVNAVRQGIVPIGAVLRRIGTSSVLRNATLVLQIFLLGAVFSTALYARIRVENYAQSSTTVQTGYTYLKYEDPTPYSLTGMADFDAQTYSTGQFVTGTPDLLSVLSGTEYLGLNHYGDNAPDMANGDWWDDDVYNVCDQGSFDAGTYSDTYWDTASNALELNTAGLTNGVGTYTSAIFDAGTVIDWENLAWKTLHPTYKPLLDARGQDRAYPSDGVDMREATLLMHLDETSGQVYDSSGNGFVGYVDYVHGTPSNPTVYGAEGRINTALDFSGDARSEVVIDDSENPNAYTDVISYGVWFKADSFRNWAGLLTRMYTWPSYGGGGYNLQVGTVQRIACGSGVYTNSDFMPDTDKWYHAVCVYDGSQMRLYVNGELQSDVDTVTLTQSNYHGVLKNDIILGDFYARGTSLNFDGQIDEAFIMHKALSASEVYEMYRRGANRLKLQVRSCADDTCSTENFTGPDGTASTYFTEQTNVSEFPPNMSLDNVSSNQYFQFEATLETDNSAISPQLQCVKINANNRYDWKYRKCFDVDLTAGSTDLDEYQVYLDVDTASPVAAGKMRSDGADIRFIDENGDKLPYFIADDMNETSTRIWLKLPHIAAGTTSKVCMYYGNPNANPMSSRESVFTYSTPKKIYHIVADTAEGSITKFASYSDNNHITIGTYDDVLDKYETDNYPPPLAPLTQTTSISTSSPINGGYDDNGTDNLVPVSFAGTRFVYRMDRGNNIFSIMSPWCDASVHMENEVGNNIRDQNTGTYSPFTVATGTAVNIRTDNSNARGLPNDSTIIIEEVGEDCPILVTHHSSSGSDSFVMHPADTEWYGVGSGNIEIAALEDGTTINIFDSNGGNGGTFSCTSGSQTSPLHMDRGDECTYNPPGSEGSDYALRVVADHEVGVNSLADSDGVEATTFLPPDDLGYEYFFPQDMQYIAIATTEGLTTTVDLYEDGTNCGVGSPDDTAAVTATADHPGKLYFGSTSDGVHIPAGACIRADEPIFAYYEFATYDDEHNAWSEVQNQQFIAPQPVVTVSDEQIGAWSLNGSDTWIRRIPVTVTNQTSQSLEDYQILLHMGSDMSEIFGKTQDDGGDIRVAGALGDGSDNIIYSLEHFNSVEKFGELWIQVPSIPANGNTTVYVYYNPGIDVKKYEPLQWLDGADNEVLKVDSATNLVMMWGDKSPHHNDTFQDDETLQPRLTPYGTRDALLFEKDYLSDKDGIWEDKTHEDTYAFVLFLNNDISESGVLIHETLSSNIYEIRTPWDKEAWLSTGEAPSGSWLTTEYKGDTTDFHVMRFESHAKDPLRMIVRDGNILDKDEKAEKFEGKFQPYYLGSGEDGKYPQSVSIGEVIIFDHYLEPKEVDQIEDYLQQKWITGPTTSMTTTGNHFAIFNTRSMHPNYYVVDERDVNAQLSIISFDDNNDVNDGTTTVTMSQGEIITVPFGEVLKAIDFFDVLGPLQATMTDDTTDTALPISYAGREFVINVGRNHDVFSVYAPMGTATVQIQEGGSGGWTTLTTATVPNNQALFINQDITNGHAVRIVSDVDVLIFHRNDTYDSKILYPTRLGFEEDSGMYELYGIGSGSVRLASTADANVHVYRSDGTDSSVVLNSSNNYVWSESGSGSQGTAYAYHIVSDAPIGASSYADADGGETATFVSQKEFSKSYILSSPAQYFAIATKDPNVTCHVYDETGSEVVTGPGTMNNVPPQTGGALSLPYPNRIHIGGSDTSDGAFFAEGYSMECDEPVYAYFERHINSSITDETSWLTWPQVRQYDPNIIVEDADTVDEEGLYFESGFDSASTASDPVAYMDAIVDMSGSSYASDISWDSIEWEEILNNRSGENFVEQLDIAYAWADPSPSCATATYSAWHDLISHTSSSSTDDTIPYVTYLQNTKYGYPDMGADDHACLKLRVHIRTGDEAYTPKLLNLTVNYVIPAPLEDVMSSTIPTISFTDDADIFIKTKRILKVRTSNTGLQSSSSHLVYEGHNNSDTVFNKLDLSLLEHNGYIINPQFDMPPFPNVPPEVSASSSSTNDASHHLSLYMDFARLNANTADVRLRFDTRVTNANGPLLTRDFDIVVH